MEKKITENCFINYNLKSVYVNRTPLDLTNNEYRCFEKLVQHENLVFTYQQLADHISNGKNDDLDPINTASYVRNYISRLKKKLPVEVKEMIKLRSGVGYFFKPIFSEEKTPEIMTLKKIKSLLGWTSMDVARAIVDNDNALYNLPLEAEGTVEQWNEFLSHYQDSFQYLVHNNKIVGNFSVTILNEEAEKQILNGNLNSSKMNVDTHYIGPAKESQVLYIMNLSVNEDYSDTECRNCLSDALVKQLIKWANQDIHFSHVYAHAYNAVSRGWFKHLGFKELSNVTNQYAETATLFKLDPFPENFIYHNVELLKELKKAYQS